MTIPEDLLKILACPSCKSSLKESGSGLHCAKCAVVYPVRDGIPVLLIEEAQKVSA